MSSTSQRRDRISGSLYGLLVGDALGCPAEGMSAETIAETYGRLDEMREADRWWRPAGLHSDDGQQAIALLDAVLEDPVHPVQPFARQLVALRDAGPGGFRRFGLHRGTGGNFRNTVMALRKMPGLATEALADEELYAHATVTAGNGAAMRVAPLALFFSEDEDVLLDAVIRTARLTHADVRGIAAAAAVAWVVQGALTLPAVEDGAPLLGNLDRRALLAFVKRAETKAADLLGAGEFQQGMSEALEAALPYSDEEIPALCARISAAVESQSDRPVGAGAGFAPASVTLSLCVALEATSYEQAIVDVISAGDDTDTTAAIVGQMVGAATGRRGIPIRWMDALWARGTLEDRIEALTTRRVPFRPGFSLADLETPWTAALYEGQQARKRQPTSTTAVPKSASPVEEPALFAAATSSNSDEELTPHEASATHIESLSNEGELSEDPEFEDEEDADEDHDDEPFWMTMESEKEAPRPSSSQREEPVPPVEDDVPVTAEVAPDSQGEPVEQRAKPAAPQKEETKKEASARPEDENQLSIFDVAPARTIGRPQVSTSEPASAPPSRPAPQVASEPSAEANSLASSSVGSAPSAPNEGPLFSPPSPPKTEAPRDELTLPSGTTLVLVKGDITKSKVDAIVNAANTSLLGGGGVDGAIHKAGGPAILDDCRAVRARQGGCKTGEAVITGAGRLPALRVIHTVGPRWRGGEHREDELLRNAYKNALRLARENNLKSVAFPSISTGIYRFPIERASRIALAQIAEESAAHPGAFDEVQIVLFEAPDLWIYQQARGELFPS